MGWNVRMLQTAAILSRCPQRNDSRVVKFRGSGNLPEADERGLSTLQSPILVIVVNTAKRSILDRRIHRQLSDQPPAKSP
jgi:hypothetical protein